MSQNKTDPLVTIDNLVFKRGRRTIFDGVNFQFFKGQITGIFGPSGCGKTTLLRLIGGELKPDKGVIYVKGERLDALSRRALYTLRKQTMGLLFQNNALFTHLTAFENVAFPLRENTHLSDAMIRDIVLMKLQAVGLRGASHLMSSELSGGMMRRVALARTIAMDPELLMYDEPFTGQDPIMMGVLLTLIKKLNDALGLASIVVSHDIQETLQIADYVYVLAEGRIIGEGTPAEIMSSDSAHLHQFMHGLPDGVVPFHYPARDYQEELSE